MSEDNDYEEGMDDAPVPELDPEVAKTGYNPTWEKIKFTGGKVLKWAAIGMLVGAVALPLLGAMAGASIAPGVLTAGTTLVSAVSGIGLGIGPVLATALGVLGVGGV